MIPDADIISEVRNGRVRRFDELFNRYSRLCLYYFLRHWRFELETAKDLTQEVFLKAFRNIHQFRPNTSFKAWLLCIARTTGIDHFRVVGRENRGSKEFPTMESTEKGAEESLINKNLVQRALDGLADRQREIVEMRYFWELASSEIGSILDLPDGTVRSELCRARKRMKEFLEREESL